MTESEFRELCRAHDLTYAYSDDHTVWQRGRQSLDRVKEAAASLDHEVAVRIWNEVVDEKLKPEYRQEWYWK